MSTDQSGIDDFAKNYRAGIDAAGRILGSSHHAVEGDIGPFLAKYLARKCALREKVTPSYAAAIGYHKAREIQQRLHRQDSLDDPHAHFAFFQTSAFGDYTAAELVEAVEKLSSFLEEALSKLPTAQQTFLQQLVVEFRWDAKGYGNHFGMTPEKVRVRLARIRSTLMKEVEKTACRDSAATEFLGLLRSYGITPVAIIRGLVQLISLPDVFDRPGATLLPQLKADSIESEKSNELVSLALAGLSFVPERSLGVVSAFLRRQPNPLAITVSWAETNRRRCDLIRKDVKGMLTASERAELNGLEQLADARIALVDLVFPKQPDEVELTVERVKREGKWIE